ncbi:MAG: HNH endonuclease [Nitrospirae bacterium]|nr:HNH endonuclease [Nitrospirota bacterium]
MKYELNPYNRNVSDTDFLNDLKRVASDIKKDSLSVEEYGKNGKYHPSTIQRRFGSWTKATELAGLQIRKNPKLSGDDLIEDLKRVASVLNKKTITQNEYKSLGKYDSAPLVRVFGSWFGALEKAGLERSRTLGVTNEEYFENLEKIWTKLGRQPKYAEIEKQFSKYSAGAYERRFGSWRKALEAFIKYINEGEDERLTTEGKIEPDVEQNNADIQTIQHKTKRNINWRLRFIIMKRDNFKCLKCGRSPSSDSSVVLHVDHIKPYSKGGETILENLETLCMVCNIGKSNLE